MTAKRYFFEGNVQGVGFRYTVKNLAKGFEVTGWVKNLPDGRVEMEVVSHDREELLAFVEEIRVNSSLAHHIKSCMEETVLQPTGVSGFSIVD